MSTLAVSTLKTHFLEVGPGVGAGAVLFGGVTIPNLYGSGGPSSLIDNYKNANITNVNLSTINGAAYPFPAAVSSINGQLSTLTVSSYVTASNYNVAPNKSIAWSDAKSGISQLDGAGGTKTLNLISDGGVNVIPSMNAPLVSTGTLTVGVANANTLNAGAVTTDSLRTAAAYLTAIQASTIITGNIQAQSARVTLDLRCDLDAHIGGTLYSDSAFLFGVAAGSISASTIASAQIAGVSSMNASSGNFSTLSAKTISGVSSMNVGSLSASTLSASSATASTLSASTLSASSVTANTMAARAITGVSTITADIGFFSTTVVAPSLLANNSLTVQSGNTFLAGNSVDITAPLRVFNNMEVMGGSTLTTSVIGGLSTINGVSVYKPVVSTINVIGTTSTNTLNAASVGTGYLAASTLSVNGTTSTNTLNAASVGTGDLAASTMSVNKSLVASSFNGVLLSPALVANPKVSTISFPPDNDIQPDSYGNLTLKSVSESIIINPVVGSVQIASGNGFDVTAYPPYADGRRTIINGVNWSTLVAVVRGLSSFS
jgi:hypothetical protein